MNCENKQHLLSSVKFMHEGCILSNQTVEVFVHNDAKALRFFLGVVVGVDGTK